MPTISVIMGVYNCARTLGDAIECIQNQTYEDWELILCNDGSIDNTLQIAKSYASKDKRIIVIANDQNRGLNYTLNHCLKYARGKYIARMDGDDLCSLHRFEKQLKILEENPEFTIVSSAMVYFDDKGVWGQNQVIKTPTKFDFVKSAPFCHAPCLVRKEAYDAVRGYSVSKYLLRVEDYHLWLKMYSCGYKGINIEEPLYQMRDDRNAYARRKFKFRINEAYVKFTGYRMLKLPIWYYPFILRPILVGLLPGFVYDILHKKSLNKK